MAKALNGTKAHTMYYTTDGELVPGVTTVTGLLNKPQLIVWANRLGLQGIDSTKYRDKAADIGTCAHLMVQCYIANENPDLSQFSQDTIDQAENALLSFFEWEKSHIIKPVLLEKAMVSDAHRFGGTVDCVAYLDGKLWLIDFKTGSGIYDEMGMQLAAYRELLISCEYPIYGCRILRIGRSEDEGFEDRIFDNRQLEKQWEIFNHLLQIYHLKQEIKPTKKARKAV
jgi:hypothetical protein